LGLILASPLSNSGGRLFQLKGQPFLYNWNWVGRVIPLREFKKGHLKTKIKKAFIKERQFTPNFGKVIKGGLNPKKKDFFY